MAGQKPGLSEYWDEAVEFLRGFFNSTFMKNRNLYRGIITGITRISKESIFSDLNNLDVIATTSGAYATAFGFTFGAYTDIYNPWSIASFIREKGKYEASVRAALGAMT